MVIIKFKHIQRKVILEYNFNMVLYNLKFIIIQCSFYDIKIIKKIVKFIKKKNYKK